MEAVLNKGAFVPLHSNENFRSYAMLNPRCSSFLWNFRCSLETPLYSRSISFRLPSRFTAGGKLSVAYGASFNERQKRSWCLCRASFEGGKPSMDPVLSTFPKEETLGSDGAVETVRVNTLPRITRAFGQFAKTNFTVVAIFSAIVVGLACPAPGRLAQQMGLTKWCTAAIFLLSGLSLRSGEIEKATTAWPAGLLGLVCILLVTPLAAIPILSLQFSPQELIAGLAIFACVPTTLSSAVSLTQVAGANTTLALGLTVVSNLIGIVTMPFTLTRFMGTSFGVSIPPGPLLQSLIQTLLLPLLLGKVLRETFSDLAKLMDGNRRKFSMLTTLIQSLVPWMQLSCSKAKLLQIEPLNLLMIASAGLALHILYLATNWVLMKICPFSSVNKAYNSRALLLVSSQKSFVVAVAVIDGLGGVFGHAGLLVLPCISGQLSQIIIDSILVNKWLQSDAKERIHAYAA